MNTETNPIVYVPIVGALLALICLLFALRAGKRRRLVDNLPTSKTTGVFIGLVELKGTAEAEQPLRSYLSEAACVYYTWSVEEHWSRMVTETYTDEKGQSHTRTREESGWTTVAKGGEQIPFYLKDDCGVILVRPIGAKIESNRDFDTTCGQFDALYYTKGPAGAIGDSTHRRRFSEQIIPLHASLYVMGQAQERSDIVAAEIADNGKEEMFLISMRSEEQVSSGFAMGFWILGVLGFVVSVAGVIWGTSADPANQVGAAVLGAGLYLFVWMFGWVWMVYNSMVELRQRVRQGWANVDVQLKRRNDLIPNLVEAVKGYSGYEKELQTELAQLRAQLTATQPGEAGPDPQGCAKVLFAVVEKYPDLKANNSFLKLQQDLIDTEQRIALARTYFNDIATFYNTRLQIVPDRFVSAMAAMQTQALMEASGFERAPVVVNLAS